MDFKGIWEKYKEQRVGDINATVSMHAPKNPILGTCPICTKEVHEDEPHIGPYGSQLQGYQYAHADCAYPKPQPQRQPQAVCALCGDMLEENDGVWWTFNTCRSWCEAASGGTQHIPNQVTAAMSASPEPELEQHATKGRGKSSAARKVFGG